MPGAAAAGELTCVNVVDDALPRIGALLPYERRSGHRRPIMHVKRNSCGVWLLVAIVTLMLLIISSPVRACFERPDAPAQTVACEAAAVGVSIDVEG
jgi:hypothetical protein